MSSAPSLPHRIQAVDWLKGFAVLFMVQTHALSLLRPELRETWPWWVLIRFDGLVAPSFFFCSGLALTLVQIRAAAKTPVREQYVRGLKQVLKVFAAATLVNAMWFNFFLEPYRLFRIDILHCIGLALLLALPVVVGLSRNPDRLRWISFGLATLLFAVAPFGETVEGPFAGLFNKRNDTVFPLLPWCGYVFFGAAIGTLVASGAREKLRHWLLALALLGAVIWALEPVTLALYPPHSYGVSSPANHSQRWFCIALILLGLMRLERSGVKSRAWKGVAFMGASSLSGYVFHEALLFYQVFGFSFHAVWGKSLTWLPWIPVLALLIAGTVALCVAWDRAQGYVRRLRQRVREVRVEPVKVSERKAA